MVFSVQTSNLMEVVESLFGGDSLIEKMKDCWFLEVADVEVPKSVVMELFKGRPPKVRSWEVKGCRHFVLSREGLEAAQKIFGLPDFEPPLPTESGFTSIQRLAFHIHLAVLIRGHDCSFSEIPDEDVLKLATIARRYTLQSFGLKYTGRKGKKSKKSESKKVANKTDASASKTDSSSFSPNKPSSFLYANQFRKSSFLRRRIRARHR